MTKLRRERDAKRVAKSVRTHEATMAAYGKTANVPIDFVAGKGHVSVPSGDSWVGIEGVTNMEYKVVPGNPGPHTLKRPRKGSE